MRFVSALIFILTLTTSTAQSIEISAGLNRLDYQIGIGYGHRHQDFYFNSKVDFGVTSTFAQKRIFPRYSIGTSYFLLKKGIVNLGPEIEYAYSRQRLTLNAKTAHHWNEINLGYRLMIGRKIQFVHVAHIGWMNESFYSNYHSDRVNYTSFGFYGQVGVNYTF